MSDPLYLPAYGVFHMLVNVDIPEGMDYDDAVETQWARDLMALSSFDEDDRPEFEEILIEQTEDSAPKVQFLAESLLCTTGCDMPEGTRYAAAFYDKWSQQLAEWLNLYPNLTIVTCVVYMVPHGHLQAMGEDARMELDAAAETANILLVEAEPLSLQ